MTRHHAGGRGVVAAGLAVLVAGCGGGAGAGDGAGGAAATRRNPTLGGVADRMGAAGVALGPPRRDARRSQKAALGRATFLANELAGAGIKTRLASETRGYTVGAAEVILRRYPDAAAARAAHDRESAVEAKLSDRGREVFFLHGVYRMTVRGPEGEPFPGVSPGLVAVRPAAAPDPGVVARLEAAFAEAVGD